MNMQLSEHIFVAVCCTNKTHLLSSCTSCFFLSGQSECFPCPAGYYCPSMIEEFIGYPCPEGHYCPEGTTFGEQFPCPRGTFRNSSLAQSVDDCWPCPGGHYCSLEGMTTYGPECDAGKLLMRE